MLRLLLQHPDLGLVIPWLWGLSRLRSAAGTRPSGGQPSRAAALQALLLAAAVALSVLGAAGWAPSGAVIAGLVDTEGLTIAGNWWLLAGLVVLGLRRSERTVGIASGLPLLAAGWWGGGALVAGVLVLATAGLEAGVPRRWRRLAGHLLLAAHAALSADRLALALVLRRWGLGLDPAAAGAALAALVVGGLGWWLYLGALGPWEPPAATS